MPIALESGALFGRAVPAACAGSSSAGRGSSSQAGAVHLDESEESEGEVQSSHRGPFDAMDALQEALPRRRESSKIYNAKPSSLASAGDVLLSPQSSKGLATPGKPSPKKRKGPLPFSINQDESRSKELSPIGDINNSPMKCRAPSSPAAASSSPCKSRSEDEHRCCNDMPCHSLQRKSSDMSAFSSPPAGLQTQFILVSMVGHQDVGASTNVISPREKRRKN
ncbi:hypothetical protein CFC21_108071 [Triticum aestivum]|uniref:Uncharacterized protein n=3 Tax=Triticum aestivum TaxID=4565 RepID=A0A9R1MHW6_WHEAT|nr:hypothetical protein CFC21_108071 [Triticum aestivum]